MIFRLGDLAELVGARLYGDAATEVSRVDTLQDAVAGSISFLTNSKYQKYLKATSATAVILKDSFRQECPVNTLVCDNPHLAYARISAHMQPVPESQAGRHQTAWVSDSAVVDPTAWIGPGAVIEDEVNIGPEVHVGPGCVVATGVTIGAGSRLIANVTLCHGITLGERVLVHPGAVIGSDGFGLADDNGTWVKVPQLGSVSIGCDVEIGANTTIDRGALCDTIISDGVKLDNQIQIAHNVEVGENTAMAACTGIAGSTRIGKNSTIGGGVVVVGHLEFADNVHFSADTLVTRSFKEPGYYSGNLPAMPNREWRKTIAHTRHLDEMMQRLKELEKQVTTLMAKKGDEA
ncbi:MAG: UDP-3-O-(3-hydroxymyristoyl)glucosamine N-acyltransferase [Gammaproteobacteria bacterium]|nr:UDP-3-O-(3-hydroxymyristoyl)glucosamine N-acyltransferase [Gammaproteobacteria bacterium]